VAQAPHTLQGCRLLGLSARQLYRRAERLAISFREEKKKLGVR